MIEWSKTSPEKRTEMFAERLKELRKIAGISAREMSLKLEQNPGYINSIEQGKSLPTITSFFSICDCLGISPAGFLKPTENSSDEKIHEIVRIMEKLTDEQLEAINTILEGLL